MDERFFAQHRNIKPRREIMEILADQQLVDLVDGLYKKCSLEFAEHLVESNVILTLSGLKPQTEFFIDLKKEDQLGQIKADVEKLNNWLAENNFIIRFIVAESLVTNREGQQAAMIGVINMGGLARISRSSHLPGVESFDPSTGFIGYKEWFLRTELLLKKAQEQGHLAADVDTDIVLQGLAKGYPDQAILDFDIALREDAQDRLVDSGIAHVGTYDEAQPNYDFFPEHADNPDIIENIRQAGKILENFYGSDWHKKFSDKFSQ